jgi:hypothetical protein
MLETHSLLIKKRSDGVNGDWSIGVMSLGNSSMRSTRGAD